MFKNWKKIKFDNIEKISWNWTLADEPPQDPSEAHRMLSQGFQINSYNNYIVIIYHKVLYVQFSVRPGQTPFSTSSPNDPCSSFSYLGLLQIAKYDRFEALWGWKESEYIYTLFPLSNLFMIFLIFAINVIECYLKGEPLNKCNWTTMLVSG